MPTNTLSAYSVVRVAEDVENQIYNFNPSDAPLLSMIDRQSIASTTSRPRRSAPARR
jgi:hypothetical protein